jgi:hypothetical protein
LRSTAAVCGTSASSAASSASGVPATDARVEPSFDAGSMSLKAGGSWSGRTTAHGPAVLDARYQRPASSTNTPFDSASRTTGVSLFST